MTISIDGLVQKPGAIFIKKAAYQVNEKISEAISFIQKNEPDEGYFLGFSGGKDSIVTRKLLELSGVKFQAVHSLTSIDPPEVIKFIKKTFIRIPFL